jgi:serine protease Do
MRSIKIILIAFVAGLSGAFVYDLLKTKKSITVSEPAYSQLSFLTEPAVNHANSYNRETLLNSTEDFIAASELSTRSVVYIKNYSRVSTTSWIDLWLGGRTSQTQVSTGSGVIFSSDGYIITNNHVVESADKIEVVYNKVTYLAELIGTDRSSDLAVLKIEGNNLPAAKLGSSKSLAVGEWVLAVGNPFNLTSTVTAGIVSAKGREINALQDKFPIESFIQTDAAINPGNSGGALVNKHGELVGINTAILSRTGTFTGYGFAVPIDIVKKIFADLVKYRTVQKAFFGGNISDFDSQIAKRLNIESDELKFRGVIIAYLQRDGAAAKAGLKEGDIITHVDNEPVNSRSAFEEEISYRSPGDVVAITYLRNKQESKTRVTLTNRDGVAGITKRDIYSSTELGAQFEALSKVERDLYEERYNLTLEGGVKVFNIKEGTFRKNGIPEEFVVTAINRVPVNTPIELLEALEKVRYRCELEGLNKGSRVRFLFYK